MSPSRTSSRFWLTALLLPTVIMLIAANISIALSQLSLGLGLLVLLTGRVLAGHRPPRLGVEGAALALAIWALGMIPLSSDPGQSLLFYRRFFLFVPLWLVAAAVVRAPRPWLLPSALLLGGVAISIFGQIKVLRETGALFHTRVAEMSNPMTSGLLLMLTLLVAMGFIFAPGQGHRHWRLGALIAALPLGLGLLQTLTRSAWLGMAAGGLIILLLVRPRLTAVFAGLALLVLVMIPLLPESMISENVAERFSFRGNATTKSGGERVEMWRGGLEMIKSHPLTGVGDRDLTSIAPGYYGDHETEYYGHLHSNPVMLAVIWGVPGFLLASWFMALPAWLLWRRWRRTGPSQDFWTRAWILAGLGCWGGFLVAGLTEWYFGDAESMLLYLSIMGAALARPGEDYA